MKNIDFFYRFYKLILLDYICEKNSLPLFFERIQFNIYSQNVLSIIKSYDNKIEINSEYKLLLISSSGCGYCMIALEKIKTLDKKVQIIVIDYSNEDELNKLKLKYDYTFLDGNKIEELGTQDLFPKLFLYNGSNKLIWKKKGWFNRNIRKINSKIDSH